MPSRYAKGSIGWLAYRQGARNKALWVLTAAAVAFLVGLAFGLGVAP